MAIKPMKKHPTITGRNPAMMAFWTKRTIKQFLFLFFCASVAATTAFRVTLVHDLRSEIHQDVDKVRLNEYCSCSILFAFEIKMISWL